MILVQQHFNGTLSFFDRTWDEFKTGFGNIYDNYWIGNERLYQLTKDGRYKLRVVLQAKNNNVWYWADYDTFRIESESNGYKLNVGGYSGTAGDSLRDTTFDLNGMKFTTRDRVNQACPGNVNCATNGEHGGGWWYRCCGYASINSPVSHKYGFEWYHLPIGRNEADRKLLVSRMMLVRML